MQLTYPQWPKLIEVFVRLASSLVGSVDSIVGVEQTKLVAVGPWQRQLAWLPQLPVGVSRFAQRVWLAFGRKHFHPLAQKLT